MARAWGCAESGSLGSGTAAGIIPTDRINPEYWRFSLGVERQLGTDWLVELSYLGQKGSHVPIVEQLNYVPQRSARRVRFVTTRPRRSSVAVVSNPFRDSRRPPNAQWRDDRPPAPASAVSAFRQPEHRVVSRREHVRVCSGGWKSGLPTG